ncbi:Os07g0637600 [Oryza sativa Japonica Group]|uniref:Os07g0637600 protein n=1 Tax=Oryza sativa subsp. japonica TaxID=39947 RepID=A0A0N7KNX5_ORYSJ|nr:hypothetical protein EE612_040906 [Oryza sativa]BAT02834.1 Os07g0637600 [Oryza sativa Japonica Group]
MATTRDLSAIDMAREAAAPGRTAGKASAPSGHHHAGARGGGGDLWSEIMASGGGGGAARIGVVYGRRRAAQEASRPRGAVDVRGVAAGEKRASFEPSKRTSWNRSLSIRGRESILFAPGTKIQPQQNPCRAQKRPPKPGNRVNFWGAS